MDNNVEKNQSESAMVEHLEAQCTADNKYNPKQYVVAIIAIILCVLAVVNLVLNISNCVRINNMIVVTTDKVTDSLTDDNNSSNTVITSKTLYLSDVIDVLELHSGYTFEREYYETKDGVCTYGLFTDDNPSIYFMCNIDADALHVVGFYGGFYTDNVADVEDGQRLIASVLSAAFDGLNFKTALSDVERSCEPDNLGHIVSSDYYSLFSNYSSNGSTLSILLDFVE